MFVCNYVRVRVVKVTRRPDGVHEVSQMNVQILLEGDNMDDVYLAGNNKKVVATDTCKNTVYCLAKENEFNSIEDFGLIICKHFLAEYPQIVNKINVQIIADKWERLNLPDSAGKTAPHKHAFRRIGPMRPFTHVTGVKRASQGSSFQVQSGFRNLDILKTTQSGFIDFHRNKFTSLPEDTDRLLGTSVDAQWSYNAWMLSRSSPNFNEVLQQQAFYLSN